jgi:ribosomal protein S18 acetylase RimI-like enzyme
MGQFRIPTIQWRVNQHVGATDKPMQIALCPARTQDFEYCKRLYFDGMKNIIEELHLNIAAQAASFRDQWALAEVRIITLDSSDVGWLQSKTQDDGLFIAQLFVDSPFQRKGIGTEVMHRLIGEATRLNQAVRLEVVKINPALRLYERLGFQTADEDDRKFHMKRDPDSSAST